MGLQTLYWQRGGPLPEYEPGSGMEGGDKEAQGAGRRRAEPLAAQLLIYCYDSKF